MKYAKLNISKITICTLICLTFVCTNSVSQKPSGKPRSIEISISTQKQEFLLGEPVVIDIGIKNAGESDTSFGLYSRNLTSLDVLIADSKKNFLSYKFSGARVNSGQTIRAHETVFFNDMPIVSHLSEKAAREVSEGRILTDYAFPEPGVYTIKAKLFLRPGRIDYVESDPIEIKINPVEGDDLKVWNIIKSDIRIGAFMQLGRLWHPAMSAHLQTPDTEASLMKEIDEIVADHPDSYLAGILRGKVTERRAQLEKGRIEQKKFDEKVRRLKNPPSN